MAVLPPFMLDTVAAIGRGKDGGGIAWTASGFLYGEYERAEGDQVAYTMFLVTNRHVLEGQPRIIVRFGSDGVGLAPAIRIPIRDKAGKPIFTLHPDPEIDVGVMPVNVSLLQIPGTKFSFFQSDHHVLDKAGATAAGLTEGDGAFVLGFPMGQVGGDRNYVIVRHGALARVRDWLAGASKEILVDATVFPGNSGGPVITRPTSTSIKGTKRLGVANLIGVVKGYVPYSDVAVSAQTGRPRITFEENSGLSAVVPFDYVKEAVAIHLAQREAVPIVQTPPTTPPTTGPEITGEAPAAKPAACRSKPASGRASRQRRTPK